MSPVLDRGICQPCADPHASRSAGIADSVLEANREDGGDDPAAFFVHDLSRLLLREHASDGAGADLEEPTRRDYFISYCAPRLEHAARIDHIVRDLGKSTYFFRHGGGSGKFLKEFQDALENSDRILCIVSRGYFESQYCRDELDAFWLRPDRDDEHRIVFLEVEPTRIPRSYRHLRLNSLVKLSPAAYKLKVQGAVEATERRFTEYGHDVVEPDEPWMSYLGALARAPRPTWSPSWAVAALCLLLVGYYLTYFKFGPGGVWDLREAATYATLGRDISLPWDWAIASTDLREYVPATTSEALDYWRRPNGRLSEFQNPGQFLQPVGLSLLKSTLPEAGNVDEGIAQYRAVFSGGSIKLLADAQTDGDSYRGFRLDNDAHGGLTAYYFEKRPGQAEILLTRLATKPLGVASSLHDIGVSKKDGLLTLWHNRAVLATWPPRETRIPAWKDGAFGLAANNAASVQLFRWSLSANRPGLPALAQLLRPVLVSFAGPFVHMPIRN